MKKKIIGLCVCMLLITTLVQIGKSMNISELNHQMFKSESEMDWIQIQKLPVYLGDWGVSVSLYGDTVLIGASASDSAYIFTCIGNTWTQQTMFKGTYGTYFGESVSLFEDTALIGAPGGSGIGSVYVYTRSENTWT